MGKIREIDGLRAAAILLVVAWHYLGASDGPQSLPWRLFIFGRCGVDLFFVLSGYLITSILLRHRASPRYFSAFYGRRAFRILPVYGVMLLIFFAGKLSGVGRECGTESFDAHFNVKSVMVNTAARPFDWYGDSGGQRRLN